ncbi:MAG TPA: RagB/SusD family nutrient uptake outer membrane protein [Longimicrobiales bacterium]|nr:RagB/SusD family nutrient uptake outer membrane protein [Longimicrobiales bacterium]
MTMKSNGFRIAVLAVLLPLGACSDLLKVESPGRIADDDLGTVDAVPGMVVGMRYDLSQAVDGLQEFLAVAAVDLFHGGSYDWADVPRGVITEDDTDGNAWNSPQQARWVAETGIERMKELLDGAEFARSGYAAEAYIYAGYANRILGENYCSSVIDGGPEVSNTVHFDRAKEQFAAAIPIATAANRTDLVNAAYAGLASVKAYSGDWAGAASDAAKVPASFLFNAEIDTELRNEITYETHSRNEYTVFGTFMQSHPNDPRAPWVIAYNADGSVQNGANGSTPHYRQLKYQDNSSDVPLSKGTEALLIRAEAALRSNDIATAYTHMNAARDVYKMAHLTQAADMTAAWADLQYERGATMWLEGRRFGDLRRWFADTGPAHNDFFASRDKCLPISKAERLANANLKG